MDINALLSKYGNRIFKVDEQDELGAYMLIDQYKIHIRNDDVCLATGLLVSDIQPLIDGFKKI